MNCTRLATVSAPPGVRDVDALDGPRRLGQLEHLLRARPGPSWDRWETPRAARGSPARRARRASPAAGFRRATGPPLRTRSAAAAAAISSPHFLQQRLFCCLPGTFCRRRMSLRYSSFEIRKLHGAVHWSIEASRQGRNHRQRWSSSSMSSEQVRNLKIFCSTCDRPPQAPALANGP